MVQLLGESSRVESTTGTKQGAEAGALAWPSPARLSSLSRSRTPGHKSRAEERWARASGGGTVTLNKINLQGLQRENEVKSVCSSDRAVPALKGLLLQRRGGSPHRDRERLGTRGRLERGRGTAPAPGRGLALRGGGGGEQGPRGAPDCRARRDRDLGRRPVLASVGSGPG